MNSEIEDFLRRLAEGRLQPTDEDDDDEIIDAELVDDELREETASPPGDSSIGSVFAEDSSQIAAAIDGADDRLRDRLERAFEHRLGQFESSEAEAESSEQVSSPATFAAELGDALRSPQSVRNAILLSEVLRRPEHRW